MGGGHKNKKWNDLHLLASYLTELFSEKLMVNKMKKKTVVNIYCDNKQRILMS